MLKKKKRVSAIQAEEKKWKWRVVIDNNASCCSNSITGPKAKKESTVCLGNTFLQKMYFQWFYITFIVRTVGIIKTQASLLFFAVDCLYILDFFVP